MNSKVVEQSGKEFQDLDNRNAINLIMSLINILKTNQNGDRLLGEKTIVKIRTKIDNLVDKIIVE